MKKLILLLIPVLFLQCAPGRPAGETPKKTPCQLACDFWRANCCPEAQPTRYGVPCEENCQRSEDSTTFTFGPECVVRSRSCEESSSCAHPK